MTEAKKTAKLPALYSDLHPVNVEEHAGSSLADEPDFKFARDEIRIPLTLPELTKACRHFPIGFSSGETPVPFAFLGLTEGENLFVD